MIFVVMVFVKNVGKFCCKSIGNKNNCFLTILLYNYFFKNCCDDFIVILYFLYARSDIFVEILGITQIYPGVAVLL
jgi:hypothetical protein